MAASLVLMCRLAGREVAMPVSVMHIRNSILRPAGVPATTRQQRWLSNTIDADKNTSKQQQQTPPTGPIIRRSIDGFEFCTVGGNATRGRGAGAGASKNTSNSSSSLIGSRDGQAGVEPRPVVVLISWLNAKRKHLLKYQALYWQRGFDVLTMNVSPVHVVRPRAGIHYISKLMKVLQEHEDLANRKVVFHGFSIGSFIYTQLQILLYKQQQQQQQQQQKQHQQLQQADRFKQALLQPFSSPHQSQQHHHHHDHKAHQDFSTSHSLASRISGLVMDSPAYMDHMCSGIANSVTTVPAIRKLISNTLLMYLAAFPKSVTFHYQESQRVFTHNKVPTLIIYSPVDLISSAETSERYMKEWQEKGVKSVSQLKLPDTEHVSHFRKYPEEYEQALDSFLKQLDLVPQPEITTVEEKLPLVRSSASTTTATATAVAAAAAAKI